ncbi:hypothetical protein M0805_000592 [Coniferiporia weirii]|nr:hypothetical protein M0805_000592 [Coniferiporia weirii]
MSDAEDVKDSKPDVKPDVNKKITISVRYEERFKQTQRMGKVFEAAGTSFGMDHKTIRFYLDGTKLTVDDTPAKLGMEDGDEISAFIEQVRASSLICLPGFPHPPSPSSLWMERKQLGGGSSS